MEATYRLRWENLFLEIKEMAQKFNKIHTPLLQNQGSRENEELVENEIREKLMR